MIEDPRIVETSSLPAAVIRLTIPRKRMREEFPKALRELMGVLERQGLAPAGPVFAHHLARPSEVFDFELGVPVEKGCSAEGRVEPGELPAATVVRTVHHGGYEGLPDAWAELIRRSPEVTEPAGLTRGDTFWEVYVAGPETSPDAAAWRTELNVPLRALPR